MTASTWPKQLLQWFATHQRDMPWRSRPSAYGTWISEIMLQQTQVDTVIPYFERFIDRFPDVHTLANADSQEVLKQWEGLGYYSRARNLQKAAKVISSDLGGELPSDYEDLQKLPGIGPYVGAAITSIAFGHPIPVVDGNVLRVFTRFWGIADDIRSPKVRDQLFERLRPIIQDHPPSDFNQAIMELGALICKPKSPKCEDCPITSECFAAQHQKTDELPFKSKKAAVPHHTIGVGVIWKNDKILIAKRKEDQMLGGLWEFPGGKQKDNEEIRYTVQREALEECKLHVRVKTPYCVVKHAYTHFKITLHAYKCEAIAGSEEAVSSDELRWIHLDEIDDYPFPTANKKVIDAIKTIHQFQLTAQ